MTDKEYINTANSYVDRIVSACKDNKEVMEKIRVMAEPWGLLGIKELKNDDFDLTIFQAGWALRKAKELLFDKEEE